MNVDFIISNSTLRVQFGTFWAGIMLQSNLSVRNEFLLHKNTTQDIESYLNKVWFLTLKNHSMYREKNHSIISIDFLQPEKNTYFKYY